MKLRIAFAGLAVAIVGWVFVPGAAHAQLDHYKCYLGKDLKTPKFVPKQCAKGTGVQTADDIIASECVDVKKIAYVCVPVGVNGELINDPSAYLICYLIKGQPFAKESRPKVEVSTQFQKSQFELKKGKLLCVPGSMTIVS